MLETLSVIGAITLGGINAWLWHQNCTLTKKVTHYTGVANALSEMLAKRIAEANKRPSALCDGIVWLNVIHEQSLSSDRRGDLGQLAWLGVKGVRR